MNETPRSPSTDGAPMTDRIKYDAENGLNFDLLPFQSKVRVYWGFLWRSLVVTIGTALSGSIIGGILGAILGVVLGLNGPPESNSLLLIQIISGITGLLWGCVCFYFYVRWLLFSKFGNYRLLLVHT